MFAYWVVSWVTPGHDVPLGNSVAAQLVGHETTRFLSLALQEFSEESPRRTPVPTGLDEKVNQVTVLVHGAPQILALTGDRDEDFVQKPCYLRVDLDVASTAGRNRGRTSRTIAE